MPASAGCMPGHKRLGVEEVAECLRCREDSLCCGALSVPYRSLLLPEFQHPTASTTLSGLDFANPRGSSSGALAPTHRELAIQRFLLALYHDVLMSVTWLCLVGIQPARRLFVCPFVRDRPLDATGMEAFTSRLDSEDLARNYSRCDQTETLSGQGEREGEGPPRLEAESVFGRGPSHVCFSVNDSGPSKASGDVFQEHHMMRFMLSS